MLVKNIPPIEIFGLMLAAVDVAAVVVDVVDLQSVSVSL
jgi:hypothetical protein